MALTNKLSAIGDAIRAKTGKSDLLTLDQMPTEIASITISGSYEPTAEDLTFKGVCSGIFKNGVWDWVINNYSDKITTSGITNISDMFYNSKVTEIPFDINITNCSSLDEAFNSVNSLVVCPKIRGTIKWDTSTTLAQCVGADIKLRNIDDVFLPEMLDGFSGVKVTSAYTCPKPCTIRGMFSLRTVPSWYYKFKLNPESTAYPSASNGLYYYGFYQAYSIDEITNIPVWRCAGAQTSNMFSNFCSKVTRAKNITFETQEDGSPYAVKWKSQDIILTGAGYSQAGECFNYNSGLSRDKWVTTAEKYELYKNDDDWTGSPDYSRYNHDSAVATINSLPDCSEYLGTNLTNVNHIRFYGDSGKLTDGGAINTLTEEEIAVAAAKGWTVTLQ